MKRVFLGLGSNRSFNGSSPEELLCLACCRLKEFVSDLRVSSLYRTKPMYYEDQNDFCNMVVSGMVEDVLSPFELLDAIHCIEASLGRNRDAEVRNGPRSIDIDIELFEGIEVNQETLQIPHPRLFERGFVLVPLLEILKENADIQMDEGFLKNVSAEGFCDIQKSVDAGCFLKMISEKEWDKYGRTDYDCTGCN